MASNNNICNELNHLSIKAIFNIFNPNKTLQTNKCNTSVINEHIIITVNALSLLSIDAVRYSIVNRNKAMNSFNTLRINIYIYIYIYIYRELFLHRQTYIFESGDFFGFCIFACSICDLFDARSIPGKKRTISLL